MVIVGGLTVLYIFLKLKEDRARSGIGEIETDDFGKTQFYLNTLRNEAIEDCKYKCEEKGFSLNKTYQNLYEQKF